MAQGSGSACAAAAAVGMAKRRMESTHTLAMDAMQQHRLAQHLNMSGIQLVTTWLLHVQGRSLSAG